jgi:hypothetical protein
MFRLIAVFAAVLLSACTWVKVTPDGEKVRVLSEAEVAKCQRVGQTTVQVLSKVGGLHRYPQQVEDELSKLARNSAVDLKGDTVTAITPVGQDGQQTFAVYRCMPQ